MRTREIKMKPYRVTDPSGRIHIAYAKTSAGAIAATQESLRESWTAEPADAEPAETISNPTEMAHPVAASDLVIGLTIGTAARAYPINMLTGPRREIINDELGGRAIAATW